MGTEIKFVDISKYNGDVDFDKLHKTDGVKAVIMTVSSLKTNYKKAVEAGLLVGCYHYLYATTTNAAAVEADVFLKEISKYELTYPVCLDIEDKTQLYLADGVCDRMVNVFMQKLLNAGYYAMLYTYPGFIDVCLSKKTIAKYPLWLAHYTNTPTDYGQLAWQREVDDSPTLDMDKIDTITAVKTECDVDVAYEKFGKIIRDGLYNLPHVKYACVAQFRALSSTTVNVTAHKIQSFNAETSCVTSQTKGGTFVLDVSFTLQARKAAVLRDKIFEMGCTIVSFKKK